jgi:hypothetical protein
MNELIFTRVIKQETKTIPSEQGGKKDKAIPVTGSHIF